VDKKSGKDRRRSERKGGAKKQIGHCVRRATRRRARCWDSGEGVVDHEEWIEQCLRKRAQIIAVSVGGFSVMENHLHGLPHLAPGLVNDWSDEEVERRWERLRPPWDKSRQPLPVSKEWVQWRLKDGECRQRVVHLVADE
jgi:hypothetical protein